MEHTQFERAHDSCHAAYKIIPLRIIPPSCNEGTRTQVSAIVLFRSWNAALSFNGEPSLHWYALPADTFCIRELRLIIIKKKHRGKEATRKVFVRPFELWMFTHIRYKILLEISNPTVADIECSNATSIRNCELPYLVEKSR